MRKGRKGRKGRRARERTSFTRAAETHAAWTETLPEPVALQRRKPLQIIKMYKETVGQERECTQGVAL